MKYKIEFYSNWHCGSGLAAGADVDALVIKDRKGLPYVPGRTIKGLLRDAASELGYSENDIISVFGIAGERANQTGCATFSNAELSDHEANKINKGQLAPYLYQTFASTAIDDEGIAKDHSLRKIETVVPCTLYGTIEGISDNEPMIVNAMKFIKRIGTGRNRGYGRCKFSPIVNDGQSSTDRKEETIMNRMKFKCTLLSDIILSQSSSSEGNQKSLDFIPGNNFLGIVASKLYKDESSESLLIFHSGKVRFGDAHPSLGNVRGLKVPAAMYYPKLKKPSEELYIHHCIEDQAVLKDLQLKQCREGFYVFTDNIGKPIDTHKGFTIKSAYDSANRRSKDGQLFGYEYLSKGLILYFEVESDLDNGINKQIVDALKGERRLGHSKTAEFGRVKIEIAEDYQEPVSSKEPITIGKEKYVAVYADSRLIFLNNNGEPTYQPKASDLNIEDGEIVWAKSQIRTFQYAPWNGKRQSYDTDRCGIEKGSVFVVKLNEGAKFPSESQYVGCYKNEGFGKVIFNPEFLDCKIGKNGEAKFRLEELPKPKKTKPEAISPDTTLLKYLDAQKTISSGRKDVYKIVEDEVKVWEPLFSKGQFASQWGSIRSIAMITPDGDQLKTAIESFLSHGVAEAKWGEMNRKKKLVDFMDDLVKNHKNNMQDIMINLASEMAKKM